MPEGTTPERAHQLAIALATIAGARAEVLEVRGQSSDPRGIQIERQLDASRFLVLNKMGLSVASLSSMEGAMAIVLSECQGVFHGSKLLYMALEANYPAVWKDNAHQVRRVYAALRKKLASTRYPLTGGKGQSGVYGFRWRLTNQNGDPGIEVAVDERKDRR